MNMPSSYTSNFLSTFLSLFFLSSNQKGPTVIIYRHAFLRITLPLKPTLQRTTTSNHLVRTSCTSVRPSVSALGSEASRGMCENDHQKKNGFPRKIRIAACV